MHVASAFGISHDSPFLPMKRASAHAISCLKTVWGLCFCNIRILDGDPETITVAHRKKYFETIDFQGHNPW